jgi:hypothetical protein
MWCRLVDSRGRLDGIVRLRLGELLGLGKQRSEQRRQLRIEWIGRKRLRQRDVVERLGWKQRQLERQWL